MEFSFSPAEHQVTTLTELAAKCVASYIPFELVEHVFPPVPEQLQLRIAYWSFPDNEEDIRLYSCLANSSADEFQRAEQLYKSRSVKDPLQIGRSHQTMHNCDAANSMALALCQFYRFSSVSNGGWSTATHTIQCCSDIRSKAYFIV